MCHLWMSKSEPPNKSPEWQTRPVCMSEMDEYSLSLRYNAEIKQTIQVSIEARFFCQKKKKCFLHVTTQETPFSISNVQIVRFVA